MGLDVTAFSKIKPSKDEGDDCICLDQDFPERVSDMAAGHFTGARQFGFRAGSYIGYGVWRDALAKLAGYDSAEHAWSMSGGPCWELIKFSDCEGAIGTRDCKKLAKDFAKLQAKANKRWNNYWLEVFNDFRKAFELASDDGVVVFH